MRAPGDLMAREMAEQPGVLSGIARRADRERARLAAVLPDRLQGTAFVARGSSQNAAVYGTYLMELASGRPAFLVSPSLYTRYDARSDYSGHLVFGVSQSGRTPEIVTTCARLRSMGAVVAALVNDLSSPLAAGADVAFDLGAGPEHAVPATKSVTAQMALLLALTGALGPGPVSADLPAQLPDAVDTVLAHGEPANRLAEAWSGYGKLIVVSRGVGRAAALEVALKCRETALVLAEGFSSADLLHGPIAAVGPDTPVLVLDAGSRVAADLQDIAARLSAAGVQLAVASASDGADLALPRDLADLAAPVVAVVRGQQLALFSARVRGLDADRPAHLQKVTVTR